MVRTGDLIRALFFLGPLGAAAISAHIPWRGSIAPSERHPIDLILSGPVTHVRDGDTIEVRRIPVRIANLDCAERDTAAGVKATRLMQQLVARGDATCALEGRMSYDREVGTCSIAGIGDVGEAMIQAGACGRWGW
jgi:endonuclease YncB( thermonuclease family)